MSENIKCHKCGEIYPDCEAMTGYKIRECPECGEPRKTGSRKPPSDLADEWDGDEKYEGSDDPWESSDHRGSPWCHETIDPEDENF